MPRLTEQCKQTIIDLYRSGMSTNEVSKQVGDIRYLYISRSTF